MDVQPACWRDRVRITTRPIEEIAVDLLVVPGPPNGLWELRADRAFEWTMVRARTQVILCCASPPLGGGDAGVCAHDWISAALETALHRGDTSVLFPALTHPDGDREIPRAVMAALCEGLDGEPGIESVWIACAGEESAARWRTALFGEDPFHPLPGIAAEVMRRYGSGSSSPLIPERAYRARSPGSFFTGSGWVRYRFGTDGDQEEYLELLETRIEPAALVRLLIDAGGGLIGFEGILSLGEGTGSPVAVDGDPPGGGRSIPDTLSLLGHDCPSLCELEAGRTLPVVEGTGPEGC
ncbi:MAG TPA: hypothetical protein PK089_07740 [Methanoregulaceae archaeon]|nr:hypothetical protein [Methanoregulaceae archaeon]HQJ87887.1 hypothetical protein [Methanoregulaceae archaeon]